MEYNKDKRTKNLTLHDIHVGDWVQVWSDATERYSPPRKITQICDDGTVYLEGSDEGRPILWVENIKNVDALEITRELLGGFGFEVIPDAFAKDKYNVFWGGREICDFYFFQYFHELMFYMYDMFPLSLKLEWKGVQS